MRFYINRIEVINLAYDSDTRVKEKLKEIARSANLKRLKLRIFDESREDQRHWIEGGLTFGPNACIYGSNDAGLFLDEPYFVDGKEIAKQTPVIAIEGSYGTETGNTGSAQYARFSHALGATIEGFIGVYFIPFKSTYVSGDGKSTTAYVRPEMIYAALNASNTEKGEYLFIDAYNPQPLIDLLKSLDSNDKVNIERDIQQIKQIMLSCAKKRSLRSRMQYAYQNSRIGKILMFNVVSFSSYNFRTRTSYRSGRFRNGHTIAGTALLELYKNDKPFDLILPRFTSDDLKELDKSHQKEWILLRTHRDISIITLDDLIFQNSNLQNTLYNFLDPLPLVGNILKKKNELSDMILQEFRQGSIKIDWDSVKKNAYASFKTFF